MPQLPILAAWHASVPGRALRWLFPAAVLLALTCPSALPAQTALDAGFNHLYNLEFERAHTEFDRWVAAHPDDPLGPASHVSAYLFQELNRLGVLESSFLKDDRRLTGKPGARPDPLLRASLYREVRRAEEKANAALTRSPHHRDALLALTITYGAWADYANMVENQSLNALSLFRKSNKNAQTLLRLDPSAYDAWTASGFTEYLVGSLPFYVRWFVWFDSVKGTKSRAVEQLELAATRGRYLRPYAKILLAVIHLREGRPAETTRLLQELGAEFPANPLFAAELKRLNQQANASR